MGNELKQLPDGTFELTMPPRTQRPSERRGMTDLKPTEGGGYNYNPSEKVGITEDVAKSIASGVGRGFVGTAGLPGDIAQLYRLGEQYVPFAARKVGETFGFNAPGEAAQKLESAKRAAIETETPEERAGTHARVLGVDLPTSKGAVDWTSRQGVPGLQYEPVTSYGHAARTAGEFIGGGGIFGAVPGAIRGGVSGLARGAVREALSPANVLAGVGAGTAHELLPNVPGAEIAGALAGARVGSLRAGRAEREAIAKGTAADILRKEAGVTDVPRILPEQYIPGTEPIARQLMPQNSRLAGLTSEIAPERSAILTSEARQELGGEAARRAAALPAATPLHETLRLVGDNPQAAASVRARGPFDVIHDIMKSDADLAWKHPVLGLAEINTPPLRAAFEAMAEKIGPGVSALDPNLRAYITDFTSTKGTIPARYVQDALSTAKENLREGRGDSRSTRAFIEAFNPILENVENVSKRFMPEGVTYGQFSDAWANAVKNTREYERLFNNNDKVFGQFRKRYGEGAAGAGENVLSSETTLDALLKGKDAAGNYKRLTSFFDTPAVVGRFPAEERASMQRNLQSSVSDWAVSKLANNGQKIITDTDLQRHMKDPSFASLVAEVPGLEGRLRAITARASGEQIVGEFRDVLNSNNPTRIADFIKSNSAELRAALPGQSPQSLAQLQQSAEVWSRIPQGTLDERRLTDLLLKGDVFTLVHGVAMGRIAQGALAFGTAKATGLPAVLTAGAEFVGAAGLGGYLGGAPGQLTTRLMYGDVAAAATKLLQKSFEDPNVMRELLKAPSVENIRNPFTITGLLRYTQDAATAGSKYGYLGNRDLDAPQDGLTIPIYNTPTGAPRPTRAFGGRAGINHAAEASSLIRMAERAKKMHNATTAPLLNQPDETITRALAIADKAI